MAKSSSSDLSSTAAGKWDLLDHIKGTIYGNCAGDAIGLLSEFMWKKQAQKVSPVAD